MNDLKRVVIYTDGACIGNPGAGGYGVVLMYGSHRQEKYEGFQLTTNNRMEIMAAIAGLRSLKTKCAVTLYTDSQYVADCIMQGWAKRWRANAWKRNRTEKALNADLWAQLLDLCGQHEVEFVWVKGHAGNKENVRCDQLSMQAAQGKNLAVDKGYEENETPSNLINH